MVYYNRFFTKISILCKISGPIIYLVVYDKFLHTIEFFTDKLTRNRAIQLLKESRQSRTFYIGLYPNTNKQFTSLYMNNFNNKSRNRLTKLK